MISRLLSVVCIFALLTVSCSKKTSSRISRPDYNVNVISDVEYGRNATWQGDNQALKLDVYLPKDASAQKQYPLLLMAHGGSFLVGDKESIADICAALANKGLIVASIDYRLGWNTGNAPCQGDTASINEAAYRAMQDFNAALRFLTANAGKYFINPDWVFTGGVSAGAVAALNSAYISDEYADNRYKDVKNKLGGLKNADNNLTNTYTIKGICSLWGGILDFNIITPSNGIPTIAYHGSADETIPATSGNYVQCPNYQVLYGSGAIYYKLTSFHIPAVAHIYEGEGHGPTQYIDNPEFIATTAYCFFQGLTNKIPESGLYKNMESNCN